MNLKSSGSLNLELKTFNIDTRIEKFRFSGNAPATAIYYNSQATPQCVTTDIPAGNLGEETRKLWASYVYVGDEALPWDSKTLYHVLQRNDEKMYHDRATKQAKFSIFDDSVDVV